MKNLSDYTDRELIERAAINSKQAATDAKWVKTFVIITAILYLLVAIFV